MKTPTDSLVGIWAGFTLAFASIADSPHRETTVPETPQTPGMVSNRSADVHQIRFDFDGLISSDVQLTQESLAFSFQHRRLEVAAGLSYNRYSLDYQPATDIDFLGSPTHVSEDRIAGQAGVKLTIAEPLKWLASGGAYDGYSDYRSVWLNEYYRQQFEDVRGFGDEYVKPNPHGESFNTGLRWEFVPATAFIQGDFSYLHDEIAPGYEIDSNGLRKGRPNLYSGIYHVAVEQLIGRRVRLLNEFRLTDTTDRRLRYNYQGSINVAPAEDWLVRGIGGYTTESPQFEAWYAGLNVEYQVSAGWWVSAQGRYYRDTGEIENSLFSSAAPGVKAWQTGLGLRHVWGGHSVKVSAAPYFTRYDPIGINTARFENLYRNRNWVSIQLAYNFEF